jgi:hypothetical protein
MGTGAEVDYVELIRVWGGFRRMFLVCYEPLGIEEGVDYVESYRVRTAMEVDEGLIIPVGVKSHWLSWVT